MIKLDQDSRDADYPPMTEIVTHCGSLGVTQSLGKIHDNGKMVVDVWIEPLNPNVQINLHDGEPKRPLPKGHHTKAEKHCKK